MAQNLWLKSLLDYRVDMSKAVLVYKSSALCFVPYPRRPDHSPLMLTKCSPSNEARWSVDYKTLHTVVLTHHLAKRHLYLFLQFSNTTWITEVHIPAGGELLYSWTRFNQKSTIHFRIEKAAQTISKRLHYALQSPREKCLDHWRLEVRNTSSSTRA